MNKLVIRQPDDFHVHFRQGHDCGNYARDALKAGFARVLVMPNTLPPIVDGFGLANYKREIEVAATGLKALMTFKIQPGMDRARLEGLKAAGALAGKLYPEGVTTNSEDGFKDWDEVLPVFALMEELNIVLCLHGEDPHAFSLDREKAFLHRVEELARRFPNLGIVLEHISTAEGIECVSKLGPNVAGTITIHHLLFTLDDLLGGKLNPHLFCKPLLKRYEDREALRAAVLSGNPKFFFGSDSAPHTRENKEASLCSAGIYTMPVSLSLLAAFFEEAGKLELLENFVSRNGAEFYRLPLNEKTITLEKEPWVVSKLFHGVVPLSAGETLVWKKAK